MKYKILTLIFISLVLSINGYAQTSLSKRLDSALLDVVKPDQPGFSIGVVRNGKFISKYSWLFYGNNPGCDWKL